MRPYHPLPVESVADILERSTQSTIEDWLQSVRDEPGIISVYLDDEVRCAHRLRTAASASRSRHESRRLAAPTQPP